MVPADALRSAWEAHVDRHGPVSALGRPVTGAGRVSIAVDCENGQFTVLMSFDENGLINGLRLTSGVPESWTPPPYADPATFTEREVVIGSGPLAVPGTLTLPHGRGPGVVLLGGGGPFDRDETSGPNKPLKDLAWGLASRGVAVVRFDKVTHAHHHTAPDMTREYVPHAVAAIHLLRQQRTVDRVFVLGHSMGGKVAPRVAAAEPSTAGLVLLAADAQPMHHAAVRVVRHLAAVGAIDETAVETIIRQAVLVDSPDLTPQTPAEDLPFGFPASYWLDLRDYDPVATAAALHTPMLILQGGRDYQVTVEDDLTRWQAGLAHRGDVTIRVHEADNHLFFPGTGPSTPAEYESAQHVDPAVVAEVADWLAAFDKTA
ncbi:MAG: hypothetical protein HOV94_30425 [Saccharothrix sp.]|nr:hypothetical protein [Saccharothrix sp.]